MLNDTNKIIDWVQTLYESDSAMTEAKMGRLISSNADLTIMMYTLTNPYLYETYQLCKDRLSAKEFTTIYAILTEKMQSGDISLN